MKNVLLLLSFLFCVSACETDFDLTSDWREIPVVYGVLDLSNNSQYIRISKSFLGEVDALDAAQVADSIYFSDELEVKIKSFRFGIGDNPDNANLFDYQDNINYDQSDVLERVLLADEGFDKDDGIFASDPAYAYKYTRQLSEDRGYLLEFFLPSGEKIQSFTPLVEDFRIIKPSEDVFLNLEITNNSENFDIRWNKADNASLFNITFSFIYSEAPSIDQNNKTFKSVEWTPIRNYDVLQSSTGTAFYSRSVSKEAFYSYLNSVIPVDDSKIRYVESMKIKVYGASEEMKNYISANAAQSGISSGQVKPEYSNIRGGIGIFTTAYEKETNIYGFSNLDEWACDIPEISELNFAPSNGNTNFPFCN